MEKDLYEILGVSENANTDEIRKAYRQLAKKYHPDKNKGNKEAEQRFKEIQGAYAILSDKEKRDKYDNLRKYGAFAGAGAPGGGFGGYEGMGGGGYRQTINFEDLGDLGSIFEDMFGSSWTSRFSRRAGPRKGEDIYFKMDIPFDLALKGGKTTIRVPKEDVCSTCGGSGADPAAKVTTCPSCKGTGYMESMQGGFQFTRPCPRCMGKGKIVSTPCRACRGSGRVRTSKTIEVKIPAGINDAAKIRIAGQGEPGPNGGPAGDLYIQVGIEQHPTFTRRGLDIYSTTTINIAQAILGTKMDVETTQGSVSMKIPAGVKPGSTFRLKGKGVKSAGGKAGDHYVKIEVEIPKRISSKQAELIKQFAELGKLNL